jgi:hypothetical protein
MFPTKPRGSINLTTIGAMLMAGMISHMPVQFFGLGGKSTPKPRKPFPVMARPEPAELAAWNEAVRQKKLARLSRRIDTRLQRLAPKV